MFTRFGSDPAAAWQATLAYHREQLGRDDPLLALGAYTTAQQDELRAAVALLAAREMAFGLSHGDPSTRNLIVPATGRPVLIDWGSATFGPVPFTDLVMVDRDAHTSGQPDAPRLRAFTQGLGLDWRSLGAELVAYRRLQQLDLARWAMDRRPDLLPAQIAELQVSLAIHAG